ncbi:MFS transporter, partial [Streptomyces sp. NPDC057074]
QLPFRSLGSCAGVALTIAIVTSAGGLGRGADTALWVSAGLAVAAGVLVGALRERD